MKKSQYFLLLILSIASIGCKISNPEKFVAKALQHAPYDVIIVPGMPHDSTWTEGTRNRVYWAKYLWDNCYTQNIIFSGGAVYSEYQECKIMKLYAMELGIPEERIFMDSIAEHSVENIYYSYYLAKHLGFTMRIVES